MIKVGCCGFPVSRSKYLGSLCIVEINRTFYRYPRLSTVVRWREQAPEDFEYTVKAHQEISHKYRLRLDQAQEPLEKMREMCLALGAQILLIQTPASFKPDNLEQAKTFFEGIDRQGLTLVWETRGPLWDEPPTRDRLRDALARLDVPHVTDPFRTMPVYTGPVAYFRLHGLGERMYYYQYADEELRRLYNLVRPFDTAATRVYVLFNNLSMFEDARRFRSFMEDGHFPSITGAKGLESVRVVISKTRYPLSKSMLTKKLGWRLVELKSGRQIRLKEILKVIPSKTYENAEEVVQVVKPQNRY